MIVNYSDKYFEVLKRDINEFDVEYLNVFNPFLKNFVFIKDEIPVGLISYSLIYDRIELEYIWVNVNYRRCGIASKLMDKMLNENVNNITLEVRITNDSAIILYRKYGFKVASIRKNYYGTDDAYLMIREMM